MKKIIFIMVITMVNETVQEALRKIEKYISELEIKLRNKDIEIENVRNEVVKKDGEKESAAERLRQMEEEMVKLSSVYEELKNRKDIDINIQEVMRLYVILTEQVLDGSAHIKLLTLLHGSKQIMTRNELSKASGIQPAATLRAIFDLRNNGLVDYNENKEEVKLIRRLFDWNIIPIKTEENKKIRRMRFQKAASSGLWLFLLNHDSKI